MPRGQRVNSQALRFCLPVLAGPWEYLLIRPCRLPLTGSVGNRLQGCRLRFTKSSAITYKRCRRWLTRSRTIKALRPSRPCQRLCLRLAVGISGAFCLIRCGGFVSGFYRFWRKRMLGSNLSNSEHTKFVPTVRTSRKPYQTQAG